MTLGGSRPGPDDAESAKGLRALRSIAGPVYVPALLFAVGQGAVLPIIALAAREVGASVALAGMMVALRGIGTMVFDIPAGMLVGRLGERRGMSVGTGILILALVGAVLSTTPWMFACSIFFMGCGWSVWLLARLAYVSDIMPLHLRGRALSTLGGVNRIGNFAGPFIGAGAIALVGIEGAFFVHIAAGAVGWFVLLLAPAPVAEKPPEHVRVRFRAVLAQHASVLYTAGFAVMCIGILRASRHAVVPLWAEHIGLDASAVGIIFGVASAMDMTLFYPAGTISDRFGRKFVAIPCAAILAVGFLLMPLTGSFITLLGVGLLIGFGNGLGAGIVMTLGADFSPPRGRAEFLGVWRTMGDIGTAGGPMIASGVTAVLSLAAAPVAIFVVGMTGAAIILFAVPEPLKLRRAAAERDSEEEA